MKNKSIEYQKGAIHGALIVCIVILIGNISNNLAKAFPEFKIMIISIGLLLIIITAFMWPRHLNKQK